MSLMPQLVRVHGRISVVLNPSPPLADDLELALHLADVAGQIALQGLNSDYMTRAKPDGTPVSDVDLKVERSLLQILGSERPRDAILSEEAGERGHSSRRWLLDPIDGTFNFIAGNTTWGTHVALEIDGEIMLGVITRPALSQRWWAARGLGAYREDQETGARRPLQASRITELTQARVSIWSRDPSHISDHISKACTIVVPTLNDHLMLAAGQLEAIVVLDEGMAQPWDQAPVVALIEEAGGRFRDEDGGHRLDLGTGTYSNGLIDPMLDALLSTRS